ncbi:MAG: peptidoglycan DD-metalloendopeptidase family protein [Ruminococcus sp.]|nr:peptidoglycan DD-metalloendopeptidase family protein [Ruminococcus sp.]
MKTKFIGIDGFGEIETVRPVRKRKKSFSANLRKFVKISRALISETAEEYKVNKTERKAAKPTRLEQHYANQRKQGAQALPTTAIRVAKQNALRHASSRRPFSPHFLKRKVALSFATSLAAVVLCTVVSTNAISFSAFASDEQAYEPEVKSETATISVNDTEISRVVHSEFAKTISDDEILTDGYGLYIDKQLVGVALDKDALQNALQKALDDYKARYDDETTDKFENDVEIVYGAYKSVYVDDSENIVKDNLDKLSFSLSTDIEYKQTVPYTTKVKYDSSKYTDYRKTIQNGRNGKQIITYRVTYVDGVQTDAYVTKTKTTKKAQKKIIVVGTKKKAAVTSTSTSYYQNSYSSGSGSFMWPLPYTRNITSGYGARWGRMHTGIDIAAGGVYGKAVVASDGGTVEWAGYDSSGYGNYVIINHNNGYKTLYGHCSAVYVSRGQSVSKGSTIAAVGSTGDSTGPHLHFEVRTSGGSRLNPLGFV